MGMLKYIADKLYSNDVEVLDMNSTEYGTFTNGGWTKYHDGTMIEWGSSTPLTADSDNRVDFQNNFVGTPSVVCNNISGTISMVQVKVGFRNEIYFTFGILTKVDGASTHAWNASVGMMYQAIGRWK